MEKANKNRIFKKIFTIVDVLGDEIENQINSSYLKYQDKVFTLKLESNFYQVDLSKDNIGHDYVFRGRKDSFVDRIDLYIPEKEWEAHLNTLYIKALETKKQQELKYIRENLENDMKQWKITEEML